MRPSQFLPVLLSIAQYVASASFENHAASYICSGETCGKECSIRKGPLREPMLAVDPTTHDAAAKNHPKERTLGKRGDGYSVFINPPFMSGWVDTLIDSLTEHKKWMYVPKWPAVRGEFYSLPTDGSKPSLAFAGQKGLRGCSGFVIWSKKGVFLGHIWESPSFLTLPVDYTLRDNIKYADTQISNEDFEETVLKSFLHGNDWLPSLPSLVGDDENPGPLHGMHQPRIFLISPNTTDFSSLDEDITTKLRHHKRILQLNEWLEKQIPGSKAEPPTSYPLIPVGSTEEFRATVQRVGALWLGTVIVETALRIFKGTNQARVSYKLWSSAEKVYSESFFLEVEC